MRIAVWHNLPSGGGKRALYDHVKGLVGRGHHIESWCPPTADASYLPLGRLIQEHVVPLTFARDQRGAWGNLTSARIMRSRLKAMDEHCERCASQISGGSFDLLFANSCMFFATNPLPRHLDLPSVLYLQEPYRALYEALSPPIWPSLPDQAWSSKRLKLLLRDVFRLQGLRLQMREEITNAAAFDEILVNSFYSRESLLRAYGLESKVCYLGIDLERFQPTGEPKQNFVIGLGGFHYHKGPDRAIEALGGLSGVDRPKLVWIGNSHDRGYEEELRERARTLGVDLQIKLLVTDTELRSLLSQARMLLYTSRLEPFGYAPLEANACGTPVVAVAEGGVRETIQPGENGLLVDNASPRKFAQAMERILGDNAFAEELNRRSVAHVRERWPVAGAVDRLETNLKELIAK